MLQPGFLRQQSELEEDTALSIRQQSHKQFGLEKNPRVQVLRGKDKI